MMCRVASETHGKLRICLYIDGINPGDPLHPDPQKLLQGLFWTVLDFPTWFLMRNIFMVRLLPHERTVGEKAFLGIYLSS